MSTPITPNADQQAALGEIKAWLKNHSSQSYSLSGLAGTGKSTIIPFAVDIARELNIATTIGTPTGKAASVVNSKFGSNVAKTIHQLAYAPMGNRKTSRKDYLGRDEYEPIFEEAAFAAQFLLIDEASMVNQQTYDRLMRTGCKILFVGDHGQLPPVKADSISPTLTTPDYTLTEIVRQAEDSPIRQLAYDVREGMPLTTLHPGIDIVRTQTIPQTANECKERNVEMLIAATNKIRNLMNHRMRELNGHGGDLQVGEKIIILSNSHPNEIYNGETYIIEKVIRKRHHEEGDMYTVQIDGKIVNMGFQWRNHVSFQEGIPGFDFGYCLTCHKAQGSQADNVAVINEPIGWMKDLAPAWRYTATTRAAKQLTVFTR